MKRKRWFILVVFPLVLVFMGIGIVMFKQHSFNAYKRSYHEGDKVEQVGNVMWTKKYVTNLKKAGYTYSDKKTDTGLSSIEINPRSHLELVKPFNRKYYVYVNVNTKNNGRTILAYLSFNQNGDLVEANYIWKDDRQINHQVTLPKSDEDRLVKQVQKEVNDFLDTMYQEIYG